LVDYFGYWLSDLLGWLWMGLVVGVVGLLLDGRE